MPARFPQATVVRLERNYRSTPEVLELANRLVPKLGGAEKRLEATLPAGRGAARRPAARASPTRSRSSSTGSGALHAEGVRARGDGRPRAGRTRARPTSRRPSTRRGSRSRARRCSTATRRGGCSRRSGAPAASTAVARDVRARGEGSGARWRAARRGSASARSCASRTSRGSCGSPTSSTTARARSPSSSTSSARASGRRRGRGVHLLTLPPREGPRVGRGLPAAARGEGAADPAGPHRRGARRGAAAALRRHHPRAAPPRDHLVGQAEPVPRRARDRGGASRARAATALPRRPALPRAARPGGASASQTDEVPAYVVFHDSTLAEIADPLPAEPRRARAGAGRRAREARALRPRRARDARPQPVSRRPLRRIPRSRCGELRSEDRPGR